MSNNKRSTFQDILDLTKMFPASLDVNIVFCIVLYLYRCDLGAPWRSQPSEFNFHIWNANSQSFARVKNETKMATHGGQFWTSVSVLFAVLYAVNSISISGMLTGQRKVKPSWPPMEANFGRQFQSPTRIFTFPERFFFLNTHKIFLQNKEMSLRTAIYFDKIKRRNRLYFSRKYITKLTRNLIKQSR